MILHVLNRKLQRNLSLRMYARRSFLFFFLLRMHVKKDLSVCLFSKNFRFTWYHFFVLRDLWSEVHEMKNLILQHHIFNLEESLTHSSVCACVRHLSHFFNSFYIILLSFRQDVSSRKLQVFAFIAIELEESSAHLLAYDVCAFTYVLLYLYSLIY
jgi:hypothetical protein